MPFYAQIAKPNQYVSEPERLRIVNGLQRLKTALADHIAQHRVAAPGTGTVRIATWNLREFGGSKYGGRGTEPLYYIAEIIAHFDVVALQEVRADMDTLERLLAILGPDWEHIATDVTDGDAGNGERMVFLFNRQKAYFTHIAGELTLPEGGKVTAAFGERVRLENGMRLNLPAGANLGTDFDARMKSRAGGKHALDKDLEIPLPAGCTVTLPAGCALTMVKNSEVEKIATGRARVSIPAPVAGAPFRVRLPSNSLDDSLRNFARTPFLVSMQSGWLKINLCTVHIYFGDSDDPLMMEQRRSEIEHLTGLLGQRAEDEFAANGKVLTAVLGDFNIMNHQHPTMQALESSGFSVPDALKAIPGSNVEKDKAYDQIAFWQPDRNRGYVKVDVVGAGVFDYYEHIYRLDQAAEYSPANPTKFKDMRTYKMSDHLPMWIELRNDFSAEYLQASAAAQPAPVPAPPPP